MSILERGADGKETQSVFVGIPDEVYITADEGLSLGLMTDLGRAALGLGSADIDRVTLPVKNHKGTDGRAYVIPTEDADAVIAAFIIGDPYP